MKVEVIVDRCLYNSIIKKYKYYILLVVDFLAVVEILPFVEVKSTVVVVSESFLPDFVLPDLPFVVVPINKNRLDLNC